MKRFWSTAAAVRHTNGTDGYAVQLDGKPVRLPAGPPLAVPSAALAHAIAAEWQAAGVATGMMEYADVPLTRLAGTAQLRILPDPAPTAAAIAVYGESDLLCYRATTPPALVMQQAEAWDPWLEWSRTTIGAALEVTSGITHVRQHPLAVRALAAATAAQGPWVLAGLGIVVPALGSLVLGLAVAHGALPVDEAHRLSTVDETYQAGLWGEDADAVIRRAHIARDLAEAAQFMALVR